MGSETTRVVGLTSAFFNDAQFPSVSDNLSRRQLMELQELKTNGQASSAQLLNAAQRSGAIAEEMIAPLLRDMASGLSDGNVKMQERLERLQAAFVEGNQRTGDQIAGIPGQFKSLEQLLASGRVDEAETVILAAKGILERGQAEDFFSSLPRWKTWIISSGLVTTTDIQAEQALTTEQKVFLSQLRRKAGANPVNFGSLSAFALNGLLDAEVHHALAERMPDLRYGVEGIKYETRDLNAKASTLVSQGNAMSRKADVQIAQGERLISQGEIHSRLATAQILEIREVGERVGEVVEAVREGNEGIREVGERVGEVVEAVREGNEEIRVVGEKVGEVAEGVRDLAEVAGHYGSLQAEQMDIAERTRLANLDLTRALVEIGVRNSDVLTGISERMDASNLLNRRNLGELIKVNEGLSILKEIAIVHLETSGDILNALGDLRETLALGFGNVVQIIDAVRQTLVDMEARSLGREQNSEKNLAQQSFQKAMEMLRIGKIDKAINFFDESEGHWPADFNVYFQRGLCYVLKEDPRAAESDFSDAVALAYGKNEARTRSLIRLNLARLYYSEAKVSFDSGDQHEYEEKSLKAIEEAKRSVDEDPKFLEAQFGLATYLAAYKLFDEALKILLKIIPKNPEFIKRLDHFDVFTPLREALKNTLGEDVDARKDVSPSQANLNIAKDCMKLGDFETAKKCLNNLFEKDPEYLRQLKIWEMPEFAVLYDDIAQMTKRFLDFAGQHESAWGYAVIGIALHLQKTERGSIYTAFKEAVEKDPDFKDSNSRKITEKCMVFAGDKLEVLFRIIRTKFPANLPDWLIKSL